jgi:hypothetical protein
MKSGHELKRQTVICVELDHRKRSRTYDEEAKQKTAAEGPFIWSFNWKHLLWFWGKCKAFSSFGYARVIQYVSFYFYPSQCCHLSGDFKCRIFSITGKQREEWWLFRGNCNTAQNPQADSFPLTQKVHTHIHGISVGTVDQ